MLQYHILKPTIQRKFNKEIYGFDIETFNKNKNFYCGSIHSDNKNFCKTFFKKNNCIDYFKLKRFKNSIISATNLSFDFIGTFFNSEEIKHFNLLWRGSDLIYATSNIHNKKFYSNEEIKVLRKKIKCSSNKIMFIDTMNYARLSVKEWGKILNISKLSKPRFLGKLPKNNKQKNILLNYNKRDSEISQKCIKFLFNSFNKLGATPKITIASSSLSLFKNRFLNNTYFRHTTEDLLNEFNAYYGGRVEAVKRGEIRNYNYYDFNSLYPSVMVNALPNPNTLRKTQKNTTSYIENFEGISYVKIYAPYMDFPLLPYRTDKLLFPYGIFKGWYSHLELRKAMELNYIIKKVYKTYYFKDICYPFKDYVLTLFNLRKKYLKENNSMEQVIKLLLNSLYGKFAQKFINRDNWIPIPKSIEEIHKYDFVERIGDFIRIKKEFTEPKSFCIPIWSLYITSYARLKLYDWILRSKPIYYDTDSLITKKDYESSTQLGALKKEMRIKYGIIVKPKFYGFVDYDNNEYIKIKGLGMKLNYDKFINFILKPKKYYNKFMKFKEAVRRGFIPNEIQRVFKEMNLEDNKRYWDRTFNFRELQESKPLEIINGISELKYNEIIIKNYS